MSVSVDIVIPVYNEELALENSILTLESFLTMNFSYKWRIVIADNASTDKTAEIVLNRGRRRLERARTSLGLEATKLENLEQHTLPLEIAELQKAVDDAAKELESARRSAEATRLAKQIALMEAESAVASLDADLAELDKKAEDKEESE